MHPARLLRALVFASLAALVFHTHVFVEFHPIRAKVVEAPITAADGTVRVTPAGFPQLKDLRPPFAVIARIASSVPGTARFRIAFDGSLACDREVEGGASRRIDCAVTAGGKPAAGREAVVSGPSTAWTLEYLELATHHGNSTGAHTFYVLPRDSTAPVRPWPGWTVAVWLAVAGLLLIPGLRLTTPAIRAGWRVFAGLIVLLLGVVLASDLASDYRVELAAGTFLLWLTLALAARIWAVACRLGEGVARPLGPLLDAARRKAADDLDVHPRWRAGGAWRRKALGLTTFALVVGLFCVPLFVNLGEPEARSDESIYFYAVERMLETGDWLTPRLIPDDRPFLEKPPLKFWLVAGGVRAGLLSGDEAGMRWFDALFGAAGFLYVFALGRRLSGPIGGLTAVLVLFTLHPLIFEHGLRSNNMEAPLFLCYCGGVYHFARWVEAGSTPARGQAFAVAAYFVLGFMTKFVAALFLPVVCLAALVWRPGGWARVRSGWSDWVLPALLAAGLVLPWFAYEAVREGAGFWRVVFGTHVYQRFTAVLDPGHLQPWHYYFTRTWNELGSSGTRWLALAGIARLAVAAARGESWLSRLVLVWGVLPTVLISFGTSKLVHYLYPFWPMIGLAAGYIVADVARAVAGRWGVDVSARLRRLAPRRAVEWCAEDRRHRTLLLGVAAAGGAAALGTALAGPSTLTIGGAEFSSRSVLIPLLVAAVALFTGGYSTALVRLVAVVGLLATASVYVYWDRVAGVTSVDHPIRAVRDCMLSLQRSGATTGPGVLGVQKDIEHYGYYYYLWRLGPWNVRPAFSLEEAHRHLWAPGAQTPVFVSHANYDALVRHSGAWEAVYPSGAGATAPETDPIADAARSPLRSGARFNERLAVLLPGPFQACLPDVLAAAGQPLWTTPAPAAR